MGAEQATPEVQELANEPVTHRFKALPPDAEAAGLTVGELAAQRRNVFDGGFTTPLLALSAESLEHNLALLETYAERHRLAFAPHGKTSMSPQLFARQLERGAWGITAAVPHQARVYRAYGIPRIFLANELVDAAALRWLSAELDADPGFTFVCYVDSVRGVELMDAALRAAGASRPVDVVVELGAGEGARTGARTPADCARVADAVAATTTLRLVGVAGYEGEVPKADGDRVRSWLRELVTLAVEFDRAGRFSPDLGDTGGSDGILQGYKPHPRAYGTFPHYLGHYARELGVLSLEETVAHLTSRPAARLRLTDRGLVREGYRADLALFDPATVAAGSTFEAPRTLPVGIPHVLIDGQFVIEDGKRTQVLAGRSVRRTPGRR
ncbi:hypothetical protein SSPIM334S_05232 [Streptomyces spiroverticillatus]